MTGFWGKIRNNLEQSIAVLSKIQRSDIARKPKRWMRSAASLFNRYKVAGMKAAGAFSLLALATLGGQHYVEVNTNDVYYVYMADFELGAVSSPEVVEGFIELKYEQLSSLYPHVHMVLNTEQISYKSERGFKLEPHDDEALEKLETLLKPQAVGVELYVDGELIAVLRDQETADALLERIKSPYVPADSKGRVSILSWEEDVEPGATFLESVDFYQDVQVRGVEIEPDELNDPEEIYAMLITGDVQPTQYTVQSGDCISCIAQKLGIPRQVIYENNSWIVDDRIRVGDVLDLTVLEPKLTVRTVEWLMEELEIPFETVYEQDDEMRLGQTQVVRSGQNGLKHVMMLVTKANGREVDLEIVDEDILIDAVPAIVKRGTKVIKGEGTGTFAWPVVNPRITSNFGPRWGTNHNGIDLVAVNRNILAADNGKVIFAGVRGGFGNLVIVDHNNGYKTYYAHLSRIDVKVGHLVEKGEKLGVMGSTGDSTGIHLHFEIHVKDKPDNPLKYLKR